MSSLYLNPFLLHYHQTDVSDYLLHIHHDAQDRTIIIIIMHQNPFGTGLGAEQDTQVLWKSTLIGTRQKNSQLKCKRQKELDNAEFFMSQHNTNTTQQHKLKLTFQSYSHVTSVGITKLLVRVPKSKRVTGRRVQVEVQWSNKRNIINDNGPEHAKSKRDSDWFLFPHGPKALLTCQTDHQTTLFCMLCRGEETMEKLSSCRMLSLARA